MGVAGDQTLPVPMDPLMKKGWRAAVPAGLRDEANSQNSTERSLSLAFG